MSEVHDLYQEMIRKGYTPKDAAKEAQHLTGLSVVTGKPIRSKGPELKTKREKIYGEFYT